MAPTLAKATLVAPALAYMPSFIDAMREGFSRDTLRPETPETIAAVAADPGAYVASFDNPPSHITLPDGSQGEMVPATTLWCVEGETFLGSVGIRHRLNANLEQVGGHVGYAVRPSARGQGLASAMLAETLVWIAANLPLKRVLLTVSAQNLASIRVIEKNGGVLSGSVPHLWHGGETALHYWIDIQGNQAAA
ncbi:GNAT family N-acetyltransferase [Phenylobacterium sp. LH3H17]|uniref:GNAT family N-acetyltransferase n=1 Tax=Phenylobacterium sp. LH3H17 TaxID=2903901 RepID=UPI0020C9D31C|nr:GNAT family N-acetyltransferase [Phenylobacterium sp. LH3H17]UTP40714.1 GNAT family N-acetyltransferase [Phenylobacterium sp. LH3H17]